MPTIWSELPAARSREVLADVATVVWILFWGGIAWTVYSFLAGFAEVGRLVRDGGTNLEAAGDRVAEPLRGLPLVGEQASDAVRNGFAGAGSPIVSAGGELETFVIVVAATLALVLLLVPLVPWLLVYVPWRLERAERVRAAHRVIRRPGSDAPVAPAAVDRVLAGRALNRLEWSTILEYTPDPIGDWEAGRFADLARAEYESGGLRRRA
jgi:hypothetical protein